MEKIQKNDFVEIGFTGKSNDQIFDTTNKEEAKSMGLDANVKPVIVSVGNEMLLKGFDESLENKEIGKLYSIHLTPEQAFGKRSPQLIRTYSKKNFEKQNINPIPGMALQLDNNIVRIMSVSGGRVMVDFNNPLAGKEIDYNFIIKRKVTDNNEKINALQDFFFRHKFDFEIKDKKVIFKDPKIKPLLDMMKEKFKQITGLDFDVAEEKEKKNIKKESEVSDIKKDKDVKEDTKMNSTTSKQQ